MGYEVATGDEAKEQSCFDGSVAPDSGEKEDFDAESHQYQEQSSDYFFFSFMLPFVGVFVGYRVLKRFLLSKLDSGTISIEQARIIQQEMYNRNFCPEEDSDTDSDSTGPHQE